MKNDRQAAILELINRDDVLTQQNLAEALRKRGFKVTQATVSRDIRELNLVKVQGTDGNYRYIQPLKTDGDIIQRLIRILADSLISAEYAGHMVVVKTLSGSANVAGEALDMLQWPEVLGTIAGDNTIFIVARQESQAIEIVKRIRKLAAQN